MSVRLVLSSTKTQYVREKGKGKETARTRDLDGDREREALDNCDDDCCKII